MHFHAERGNELTYSSAISITINISGAFIIHRVYLVPMLRVGIQTDESLQLSLSNIATKYLCISTQSVGTR